MPENKSKKVFVAMSGGVDSSVAALLLKREGYDVTGAHMICADFDLSKGSNEIEHPRFAKQIGTGICRQAQEDRRDAMRVAASLDIPFMTFDFKEEYRKRVFDYMIREYVAGCTPNPDVICNSEIKFGIFLERAISLGADYIATGHYARIMNYEPAYRRGRSRIKIYEAKDKNKDQSYFLCRLTQKQLSRAICPIGDYLKSEVRKLAQEAGLITASKKDSQGLCFVGKIDFLDFLKEKIPIIRGNILDSSGKKIGEHEGAHFSTIGQRHGIGVSGMKNPMFVVEKNIKTNTITMSQENDSFLYKKEIEIKNINWILGKEPQMPFFCFSRIRYRQPLQEAILQKLSNSGYKLNFNFPQRAISMGQSAVFYTDSGEMMGGGVIV